MRFLEDLKDPASAHAFDRRAANRRERRLVE
jgi:hypothetical protein